MKYQLLGKPVEFGNTLQINHLKKLNRFFSGEEKVHTIEWSFCKDINKRSDTGKPYFKYCDFKEADSVVDFILCPKCGKRHCLFVNYDPQGNWFDELMNIDNHVKNFECWNCSTQFETDEERNVFISS